ncbi:MAG: ribonucleotide-diphosphate reductase subunit beta [Solirubrobacterales bacterium]|nr:ribonucleotide-diphosphate reductase subunit beta [Solirubrobacterales bacterium]
MPGSGTIAADQVSYADLYARWEHQNWRATDIDFARDRDHWRGELSDIDRRSALWTYSLFFHGEDSVTDNLSPFIEAAPREEQKYFLATQQVDEARHAVLFARFIREVVGAGASVGSALEATRPRLTWGFRKVFERLDRMADELRRDRARAKLAQAITLYHVVIEASLAQPGQHFIEEGLGRRELLPGLCSGIAHVSRDEQRHIAFGVKMIADLVREDPDCEPAIAELLREVLPFTAAVFVPPGWDERYVTSFGFTLQDIFTQGAEALDGRLRAAGLDPTTMRLGLPFDRPPAERAHRGLTLLRAGYLGEPNGGVTPSAEATAMLFDGLRRQVDPSAAPGAVIQWDFSDAEPWHLRIDNGNASVAPGRAERPDLTLHCRFADWVDITAGRIEPWRALLAGKLRPTGRVSMLVRARKLFG